MNPFHKTVNPFRIGTVFFLMMGLMSNIPSFGQHSDFLDIKAGFEHIAHRDKGMSPLRYAGYGFFSGLSWDKYSPSKAVHFAINFSTGLQRNKYDSPIIYNRGDFQVYTFYHQNKSVNKEIIWGWFNNNAFSHRYNADFVNFNHHYEYFTNVGPAAKYAYPISINGRVLALEGLAYVQLVGFMIRPSYTSSYPEGFLREQKSVVKGLVHSIKVFHPGNSWNIGFKPRLIYTLKSGNKLSLGYSYEFYKLNASNPVSQSSGIWFVSLSSRL